MSAPDSSLLTPSDGGLGSFGRSVALSADGRTAIVGASADDVGRNSGQGSASVFAWDSTTRTWVQLGGVLTAADGDASDQFGQSVALSADGRTAIVGGPGDDVDGKSNQGTARVFTWDSGTNAWVQRGGALTPTDGAAGDQFGQSVAVSSDGLTAVVGGSGDDVDGKSGQGSARVFVWDNAANDWVQRGDAVTPTDGAAGDQFGQSVAVSSDGLTAMVGGPGDDVGDQSSQGSARIFVWDNGLNAWVQRGGPITPADGSDGLFGQSVALSSDGLTAMVGGPGDDEGQPYYWGSARVYVWDSDLNAWTQRGPSFTPSHGFPNIAGASVALSSDGLTAIAGGVSFDVGQEQEQGDAHVSVWDSEAQAWTHDARFRPGDVDGAQTFGRSVALSGDGLTALVGTPGNDSASVFTWDGSRWREGVSTGLAFLSIAATSASKAEGNEGSTPFTFTVTRSGVIDREATASWRVTGTTSYGASADDFVGNRLPTGRVTFLSGETSKVITVNVAGDSAYESTEGFIVTLRSSSLDIQFDSASAEGSIIKDDAFLLIDATSAKKAEGNSGSTPFTFTVTRGGNEHQTSTATWTVTGAADHGASASDFVGNALPSGTVTFLPGETSKLITVNVAGDGTYESNEGFTVTLSDPSAGTSIKVASRDGKILNDDPDGQLSIAAESADKAEGRSGTTAFTFTVTRTGDTSVAHSAAWSVSGAAVTAADFAGDVLPSGVVEFAAGETSKTITVDVAGDRTAEPDEAFTVTLSSPSAGASLGTASAIGTIRNDDPSNGDDSLTGTPGSDDIDGLAGNDSLFGLGGNDRLAGGAGDDTVDGGAGLDIASYAGAASGVVVSLATGAAQDTGGAGIDTLIAIEKLEGSSHDDTLTGNALNNMLFGELGNDVLNGGGGNDRLDGGLGIDTASYAGSASGVWVSLTVSGAQDTLAAGSDTLLDIENLKGSSFDDTLRGDGADNVLAGRSGDDLLNGGAGDDLLDGSLGVDTASYIGTASGVRVNLAVTAAQDTGGAGIDTLVDIENLKGSSFDDVLRGDDGDNVLAGRSGSDILYGRGGSDVFVFDSALVADNVDKVSDFDSSDDTIHLASSIFAALAAGASLSEDEFHVGSKAADASDRIIYNSGTGALLYDADGTGSGAATKIATLSPGLALTHDNFWVV